jgi:hypothetical protein
MEKIRVRRPVGGAINGSRQLFRGPVWRIVFSFAVAMPLLALVTSGSGQAAGAAPVNPANSRLEMGITGNGPAFSSGEPEIAINPTNPDNLFLDHATFPVPAPLFGPAPAHSCGGYVSMDRGKSWQSGNLPFAQQSNPFGGPSVTYAECEDGIAAFGPDGTLYAGGDTTIGFAIAGTPPCPPGSAASGGVCYRLPGDDPFARSTDGGQTWTALPHPIGSVGYGLGNFNFAPGSGNPVDTYDRPWVVVDQSTGVIYFAAGNILDHERFVTHSTDKGQTFGTIYAMDSPTYPQGGNHGSNLVAANGVLAQAYTAAPAPGGCTETCLVFETSTDFGATWNRHIVPLVSASSTPEAFLAADPVGRGNFALSVLDATGTENQVYTTRDSGQTWQGPTDVAEGPPNQRFKPWLNYGPSGQLVLVWRTWEGTPDLTTTPYDVWAAIGRAEGSNGAVFSSPLRVSSVAAPFGTGGGGDDFSYITADNRYIHVAWGDSRSGATQVWYSRIPLTAFRGEG